MNKNIKIGELVRNMGGNACVKTVLSPNRVIATLFGMEFECEVDRARFFSDTLISNKFDGDLYAVK